MYIDMILSGFAVEDMISSVKDYEGNILFVRELSDVTIPIRNAPFMPQLEEGFNRDKKLGFVYGKGSGCAFIRKEALEETLSFAGRKQLRISCCYDLLIIMKQLKFKIKQVDYCDLDFQNIRSIPQDHPTTEIALMGGLPLEAPRDDKLNAYLDMQIRRGALKLLHGL